MKLVTTDNLYTFLEQLNSDNALGNIELHNKVQEALNKYLLNFDYTEIEFNTGVTLTGGASSGVLGVGQLGLMVLGTS